MLLVWHIVNHATLYHALCMPYPVYCKCVVHKGAVALNIYMRHSDRHSSAFAMLLLLPLLAGTLHCMRHIDKVVP
jgi:hypothetical protein